MSQPSRSAATPPARASAVHCAAGLLRNTTSGLALVGIRGTPSIPEEYARPAFISGPQPSAYPVVAGHRIPIGIRIEHLRLSTVLPPESHCLWSLRLPTAQGVPWGMRRISPESFDPDRADCCVLADVLVRGEPDEEEDEDEENNREEEDDDYKEDDKEDDGELLRVTTAVRSNCRA